MKTHKNTGMQNEEHTSNKETRNTVHNTQHELTGYPDRGRVSKAFQSIGLDTRLPGDQR